MNTVRAWVAMVALAALVPGLLTWFLVHPFAPFWRRVGPWVTYSVLALVSLLLMAAVFISWEPILAWDLGTNGFTMALGVMAAAGGMWMALKRRGRLTTTILVGLPEVSTSRYPGTLLTRGIYGKIRHPRYVEVALWVLGYALFTNFLSLYLAFLATLPTLYLIILLEERELANRFGDEWRNYAARVPRFIPSRTSMQAGGSDE